MQPDTGTRTPQPASGWLLALFGALLWAGGASTSLAHELPPYTGGVYYNSISLAPPILYTEPYDDLSVKVLGGKVTIRRSFSGHTWHSNFNWAPLKLAYEAYGGTIKTITRGRAEYTRHSVGVYQDKAHHTIRQTATGFRWQDKTGNWIEYDAKGVTQSYGDRNNIKVSISNEIVTVPNPQGGVLTYSRMTGVYDHFGAQVIWFEYAKVLPTDLAESLVAVRDASSRRVEYKYNQGQLSEVLDANGALWLIGYTPLFGNLTPRQTLPIKFTDPEGRVITRTWFGNGEIAQIRYTDGTATDPGTGIDYHYEYDLSKSIYYIRETTTAGKITETWNNFNGDTVRKDLNRKTLETWAIDPAGRSHVKTDARGLVTSETRDAVDNITRIVYPDGSSVSTTYDPRYANPLTKTDELGVITKYEYDTRGNLTKLIEAQGLPEQRVTEYSYDQYGQRKTETKRGDANTQEALTQYDYDSKGNLIQVIDAENNITKYPAQDYDVMGNAKTRIDARGKVWTKTYDNRGMLLTDTDPLNHATTTTYDKAGLRKTVTDALTNLTQYGYDVRGNIISVTDPYGAVTKFEYNSDNQRTKITDAENKVIEINEYNLDGLPAKLTDGNGNVISLVYGDEASGLNSLLSKIIYPTFSQEIKYDSRDRVTQLANVFDPTNSSIIKTTYNAKGLSIGTTDAENKTTHRTYDVLGRLNTITDPATGVTVLTFDSRNNLVALKDPKNPSHRFTYDRVNRKLTEARPLGQTIITTYSPTGQIDTVTDPKGQVKKYSYDDAGRRTAENHYLTVSDASNNNPSRTIGYSFSDINIPTGYSDGAVSTATNTYDAKGLRKVGESVNYGTFSLGYSYDYYANGLKKSFTGPDGVPAHYTYDANNQLATVQLPSGNITVNSYKWDVPSQVTYPGGTVRAQSYDSLTRTTQIVVKDPGQSELMNYQYSYDKVDNIKTRTTEHGNYSYDYDDLYRLKNATNPSPLSNESYTYDSVGNRLTDAKTTQTWGYNDNNQLQGFDGITFDYDANGNTIRKTDANDPSRTRNFVYDTSDRLIEVKDQNNTLIVSYTYDPFNRRIAKETTGSNGKKTYFVYADEGLIAEADGSGVVTTSYGYKPEATWTTDLIYLKSGNQYYYYQNDRLGTSQKLLSQNGSVVWSAKSDGFGNLIVDAESIITNNLRLAGQYFDAETGLHYNWNRYYDPTTGRYITSDPIGINGDLNNYAYGSGNPLNLQDPMGLFSIDPCAKLCLLQYIEHLVFDVIVHKVIEVIEVVDVLVQLKKYSRLHIVYHTERIGIKILKFVGAGYSAYSIIRFTGEYYICLYKGCVRCK